MFAFFFKSYYGHLRSDIDRGLIKLVRQTVGNLFTVCEKLCYELRQIVLASKIFHCYVK